MSHCHISRPNVFAHMWSKTFKLGRRQAAAKVRPRVRPQLEHLEDRLVPTVIDVTTLADGTGPGTLRSAIAQANINDANGDTNNTINLTVAGTYNIGQSGLGALSIFNNATATQSGLSLTIQNTSGATVAINGNNLSRVFDINPNVITPANNVVLGAVTINGVTIENGLAIDAANPDGPNASGGGIRDQGPVDLTLDNDLLANNSATADGGGVSMENTASTKWKLTLNNTTVINNHAGDAGGGIDEDGTGLVDITNSTIADNTCLNQGAGVWLDAINGGTAKLNVTNSVVSGNTAGALGGGLGNAGNGVVSILDSTIENNFTTGFGGGFADQNNLGTLAVQNSLFLNNSAGTNGGGIQEGNGLTITNSEIKGNAAGINGAMPIGSSSGKPNTVMGSGGGLFVNGGSLTLTNSTIADNTATINGGGIDLETTGASAIRNTTIAGNTALSSAGGNDGGGIDAERNFTGSLQLLDDTITNNFAVEGGGVFYNGGVGSTISTQNTIIAQNMVSMPTGNNGPDAVSVTSFTDLGGNLIGISGAGSGNSGFTAATTQTGTLANPLNPMLTGLSNNGGPVAGAPGTQMTVETEALLPGSPAIGKGMANGIAMDERGAPILNTNDVGAFQFENATLTVTIHAAPTVGLNGNEQFTVTLTNTSNNPLPADNGTLVVTASGGLNSGGPQTIVLGALGAGQSANLTFNANAVAVGMQTITATVTTPDSNPLTVSTSATVNVTQTTVTPPTHTPVGGLTLFGIGLGPTGIDLFEVDSAGDIFALPLMGGSPIFLNSALHLPLVELQHGQLLALLAGSNGQEFVVDIINPFLASVEAAVLAGLHL